LKRCIETEAEAGVTAFAVAAKRAGLEGVELLQLDVFELES
jgi:hypothetical protein